MKLPLKTIVVLVVLSLTTIFAYQAYWLINMYGSQTRLLDIRILEAMRSCDYNEMILRVRELKSGGNIHGSASVAAGYSEEGNKMFIESSTSVTVSSKADADADIPDAPQETVTRDTIVMTSESPQSNVYVSDRGLGLILEEQHNTEQLAVYFQQGLHSGIDLFCEPNVAVYDSLLTERLQELGISKEHRLLLIENGRTYSDTIAVHVTPDYIPSQRAQGYEHSININNRKVYVLQIEPVGGLVIRQMAGILATSLLILIVLAFSFYYLIRTLLRQKTLEEMKSDFTNNITHELKTPIAVAYAANDTLLNFGQSGEKATRDKYLRITQGQLRHLSELVEQILSMSMERRKGFRLHLEEVQLKEVITPLIEQHKLKANKPVEITTDISPADFTLHADRIHLSNILSNLIDNAIKYSTDEARVAIKARILPDKKVEIVVSDQGIGITPEQCRHIFDKFYRVPTGNLHNIKGYGLGLFYVKTMVEKHGGNIQVESTPGKGSRFIIKL